MENLGYALISFCGIAAIVLLGQWLITRVMGQGRACTIGARLEIGTLPIEGQITLLGNRFCQFRPVDSATYRMLKHYADTEASRLCVEGLRVPMRVRWMRAGKAVCHFEVPLPEMLLQRLLERSRVPAGWRRTR